MTTVTIIAALFSLALTLFVVWINPYRFSNQAFALVLLVQTGWLGCVYRAMQIGASTVPDKSVHLEWWFRANAAVISFLPATMWFLKEAILSDARNRNRAVYASVPFFILSLFSSALCFMPLFVSRDTLGMLYRGAPYYVYSMIGLGVYTLCLIETFREMRVHKGIQRVELQFLALNAGGAGLLLLGLNAVGNLLHIRTLNRLSVLLVLAASALTACALLMHRVFNAWEVFLQFAQRLWFVLILSGGIYGLWRATLDVFAEPFGLLFSVAVFSPIAVWLDKKSRTWFDISGDRKLAELRRSAIEITYAEAQSEELIHRFEALLQVKFQTESACFMFDNGLVYGQYSIIMSKSRAGHQTLCDLGWATPESLDRRRATPGTSDLKEFLHENTLGLVIPVPRGTAQPSSLVAFATRADDRPYTFPEIERIQNLAEFIDSILTRSKLTTQAAIHARVDYLAMMSRGLAHDLKNLITPISTFLIHTERSFQPKSAEAEVHAAAKCAARAMTDYVRNTLSFPDRMDLQLEEIRVKSILDGVRDLMTTHAGHRGVRIVLNVSEQETVVCDRVLIQRMLGNLVSNAIDASSHGQVVSLGATDLGLGWVRFEVRDDGCGIPAEYISRVFDPYFTTKNRGEDVRGFGLGLTIAHKIVLLHRGNINVQSKPGQQTVVRVDLPGGAASSPSAVS
jgi:signal transduction histidine kinase